MYWILLFAELLIRSTWHITSFCVECWLQNAKLDVLERLLPSVVEVSKHQLLQSVLKVLSRRESMTGTRRAHLLSYVAVVTLSAFKVCTSL